MKSIPIKKAPSLLEFFAKSKPKSIISIINRHVSRIHNKFLKQYRVLKLIETDAHFSNMMMAYQGLAVPDMKKKARRILIDKLEKFKQLLIEDK